MIYAIGDIHGQIDMLHTALDLIAADGGADAQVIFVGDYTDRGPNSKAVIDTLIKDNPKGAIGPASRGTMTACSMTL